MMPDNGGQPIPVLSGYGLAPLPSDSAVPSLGGYHYDYTDSLQLKEQKLSEALAVLFSMIEYQPETKVRNSLNPFFVETLFRKSCSRTDG